MENPRYSLMRTSEKMLIKPALEALLECANPLIGMPSSQLFEKVRSKINPTAEDLEILKGRKDDKLSQVLRNLRSHRTLEKTGFVKYEKNQFTGLGWYKLTDIGLHTLRQPEPDLFLYTYKNTK